MKKILVPMLLLAGAASAQAASYRQLYAFNGQDGAYPYASLTAVHGKLYGTTSVGGAFENGVLFAFSPQDGKLKVIHGFGSGNDGSNPFGGVLPSHSVLYGLADQGGEYTFGAAYSVQNTTEKVLHSFGAGSDVYYPQGNLIEEAGTLYGVGLSGGANNEGGVFSLAPDGSEKVLHAFGPFGDVTDGTIPQAGLTRFGGIFYGITASGGPNCGAAGCGTVFSIDTSGNEKLVYSFGTTATDGNQPYGLLLKTGDSLLGTTYYGGTNGVGTVFSVTAGGTEKVLYSFGTTGDGNSPYGGLIELGKKFYGTTSAGGQYGLGTVFSLTRGGKEKVLHSFAGGNDGATPSTTLTVLNGVIYGTAVNGGSGSAGTIFSLTP
jgi:uncharacterized repeat protein (TIGR03803 family)